MVQDALTYELKPWLSPSPWLSPCLMLGVWRMSSAICRPSVRKKAQFYEQQQFQRAILSTPSEKPLSSPQQILVPDPDSSPLPWTDPFSLPPHPWFTPRRMADILLTTRALLPFPASPVALRGLQRELNKSPALLLESLGV